MKYVSSVLPLPESDGLWMYPIEARQIIFFGEATAVIMSAENSDHYYNYKSVFQIWKESKNFERQNILMSRPPLDLTPFFTNTKKRKSTTFGLNSC